MLNSWRMMSKQHCRQLLSDQHWLSDLHKSATIQTIGINCSNCHKTTAPRTKLTRLFCRSEINENLQHWNRCEVQQYLLQCRTYSLPNISTKVQTPWLTICRSFQLGSCQLLATLAKGDSLPGWPQYSSATNTGPYGLLSYMLLWSGVTH